MIYFCMTSHLWDDLLCSKESNCSLSNHSFGYIFQTILIASEASHCFQIFPIMWRQDLCHNKCYVYLQGNPTYFEILTIKRKYPFIDPSYYIYKSVDIHSKVPLFHDLSIMQFSMYCHPIMSSNAHHSVTEDLSV